MWIFWWWCLCFSELDIFGIVLFSVLTLMATVSMLVFIEECIYIYKKVPPNKKSVIIWVTGAAPVSSISRTSVLFIFSIIHVIIYVPSLPSGILQSIIWKSVLIIHHSWLELTCQNELYLYPTHTETEAMVRLVISSALRPGWVIMSLKFIFF